LQLGKTATTLARVGTNLAVDATVSAGSQYAKTGDVNGQRVVVDVMAGFAGSQVTSRIQTAFQNSSTASKLFREASDLSKITSVNPPLFQSQVNAAKTATDKALSYGNSQSVGTGIATSTFTSKLFDNEILNTNKGDQKNAK